MCEGKEINYQREIKKIQDAQDQINSKILLLIDQVGKLGSQISEDLSQQCYPLKSLTKSDVCEILCITTITLDKLIKSGEIAAFRVAKRNVRIQPKDLQSYMDRKEPVCV